MSLSIVITCDKCGRREFGDWPQAWKLRRRLKGLGWYPATRDNLVSNAGPHDLCGACARSPIQDVRPCGFCGYQFDHERLGKFGCPSCEGPGFKRRDDPKEGGR